MFRLNGVHLLFWCNWYLPNMTLPNPHQVFPVEILHHLHKLFWDHGVKWVIRAVGDSELNLCFSLIQPHNGYCHFSSGISSLKQVTGRDHRDVQRYILALIPDGSNKQFILCIQALLDLRYLLQLQQLTNHDLNAISSTLQLFHMYKQVILDLRLGTAGPINNFEIPKLEFLQSIVSCVQRSGALPQWSADVTEHLHIIFVKNPRKNTNSRNYPPQICCNLDRQEKCWHFDLATRLKASLSAGPDLAGKADNPNQVFGDHNNWMSQLPDIAQAFNTRQATPDLFAAAAADRSEPHPGPFPWTFATPTTTFHLNNQADVSRSTVDNAALKHEIPDLLQAMHDFLLHFLHDQSTRTISGRRGPAWDATVPFQQVRIWYSVRVQTYSSCSTGAADPQKLFASPLTKDWPHGQCDTAMFTQDATAGPLQPPLWLNSTSPHCVQIK